MRGSVKVLAVLVLAASVTACGGQKQDGPTAEPTATGNAPEPQPTMAAGPPMPPEFAQCRSCHSVEPGKNGIGPTLHGLMGTKAGEVPGFAFSPALKQSGITWDRATLDQWLAGPMKMVPGTRMVIAVPDPVRRKAIVDYIEKLK